MTSVKTPVSEVDRVCLATSQTPRASGQVGGLSFEDPKLMALKANQCCVVGRSPTAASLAVCQIKHDL